MNTLTDVLPARPASLAAALGFFGIAAFQLALALGAPFERAAWGGTHEQQLPTGLRIASAVAIGVWVLASLIVLGRAGFEVSPLPSAFVRWGTWILVGVSVLGSLVNFASPSSWERFVWGPVALILAGLCLVVARSGLAPSEADRCPTIDRSLCRRSTGSSVNDQSDPGRTSGGAGSSSITRDTPVASATTLVNP